MGLFMATNPTEHFERSLVGRLSARVGMFPDRFSEALVVDINRHQC